MPKHTHLLRGKVRLAKHNRVDRLCPHERRVDALHVGRGLKKGVPYAKRFDWPSVRYARFLRALAHRALKERLPLQEAAAWEPPVPFHGVRRALHDEIFSIRTSQRDIDAADHRLSHDLLIHVFGEEAARLVHGLERREVSVVRRVEQRDVALRFVRDGIKAPVRANEGLRST